MDNQLITALENSKNLSDEDKRKYYILSQNLNPTLKEILLKVINSNTEKELLDARSELSEYLVQRRKDLDLYMKDWIRKVYVTSEKVSMNQDKQVNTTLLEKLKKA